VLKKKPNDKANLAARAMPEAPLFNFRSYKAWLPRDVQQQLANAEALLAKCRKAKSIVRANNNNNNNR
jgi:hypothetical protein